MDKIKLGELMELNIINENQIVNVLKKDANEVWRQIDEDEWKDYYDWYVVNIECNCDDLDICIASFVK